MLRSDSLWPHGLQHTRLPCPSPTPRVYLNSCPLSRWCHPTILVGQKRRGCHHIISMDMHPQASAVGSVLAKSCTWAGWGGSQDQSGVRKKAQNTKIFTKCKQRSGRTVLRKWLKNHVFTALFTREDAHMLSSICLDVYFYQASDLNK